MLALVAEFSPTDVRERVLNFLDVAIAQLVKYKCRLNAGVHKSGLSNLSGKTAAIQEFSL